MLNKTCIRYVVKDSTCSYTLRFILSREREELTNLRFKTQLRLSGIGCDLKSTGKHNKITEPDMWNACEGTVWFRTHELKLI